MQPEAVWVFEEIATDFTLTIVVQQYKQLPLHVVTQIKMMLRDSAGRTSEMGYSRQYQTPYRGYWNSRLFFTLDHLEFQLFHLWRVLEFQTFFTWPHLEFQTFLPLNSRLFYTWAQRGCWNSRLFCRNCLGILGFFFFFFLSTALGIPNIFVTPVWNSIFFVGEKITLFRGVGYCLEQWNMHHKSSYKHAFMYNWLPGKQKIYLQNATRI